MSWEVREGDCVDVLRTLDAGSVQTCVTSPPFWGLRDYGHEDQLGLEPTPEEYVANLVGVFREVRRVLRDDGTVWLNLGDSYASGPPGKVSGDPFATSSFTGGNANHHRGREGKRNSIVSGLKPKDLCGIPWRVAFALQADGWWLRSDIIWSKPNPMPESVTDRPTRAHEYIFLLSKSARYFYDADAIREPAQKVGTPGHLRSGNGDRHANHQGLAGEVVGRQRDFEQEGRQKGHHGRITHEAGRNRRSVWEIATQPYSEAHFATFPPKLIEPCILAGSPPKCCGECGAPWERVTERGDLVPAGNPHGDGLQRDQRNSFPEQGFIGRYEREQKGWRSTCDHDDDSGTPTVLDPFTGAGTTGLVATQHGRDFIGIELSPEYAEMARQRIRRWQANPAGALDGGPDLIEGQIGLLDDSDYHPPAVVEDKQGQGGRTYAGFNERWKNR